MSVQRWNRNQLEGGLTERIPETVDNAIFDRRRLSVDQTQWLGWSQGGFGVEVDLVSMLMGRIICHLEVASRRKANIALAGTLDPGQ